MIYYIYIKKTYENLDSSLIPKQDKSF